MSLSGIHPSWQNAAELLMIPMIWGQEPQGLLVFEIARSKRGFKLNADQRRKLVRFSRYALSAVTKARFLHELSLKSREVAETQRQLARQKKMASLGTLAAGIAHELSNPLNFIANFSELNLALIDDIQKDALAATSDEPMAEEQVPDAIDELNQNVQLIHKHGKRAISIIRDMMMLFQTSNSARTPTDIHELLQDCIVDLKQGLPAEQLEVLGIECDFDPNIAPLELVPQTLKRVILNLLNNAAQALWQRVRAEGRGFHPRIQVQTRTIETWVQISVEDNGPGIPENIRERVFEPFFTTKPQGEGTGLGLPISYDIVVNEHGGQMSVTSEEGDFTRFELRLPKNRTSDK
jgi:signal transduction histidine kinase